MSTLNPWAQSALTEALIEGRAFSVWSRTYYVEYENGHRVEYVVLDVISYAFGNLYERKHSTVPVSALAA